MPVTLQWYDVALRLFLTVVAGALLGLDRSERGRVAGLRTVLLVTLAASVAMIQANLLLPTVGKAPDSFVHFDIMRLPLGILTGMGFIGGGAILHKGRLIIGVTTAATLWFATVLGLCFGGGQIYVGLVGLALGLGTLAGLKKLEQRLAQERRGTLALSAGPGGPTEDELRSRLVRAAFRLSAWTVAYRNHGEARELRLKCQLAWHGEQHDARTPPLIEELARLPGVLKLRWKG